MILPQDVHWMSRALDLARQAATLDEVPVGALVVAGDKVIGEGWNCPISDCDPSAHAEILALRAGAKNQHNYRLPGTTIYVTLEPCVMCLGAIIHARVERLVFAAYEPRAGAVCSHLQLLDHAHFNHRVEWQGGVMQDESSELLRSFFQAKRKK